MSVGMWYQLAIYLSTSNPNPVDNNTVLLLECTSNKENTAGATEGGPPC